MSCIFMVLSQRTVPLREACAMFLHRCTYCLAMLVAPSGCAGTQVACPVCAQPVDLPTIQTLQASELAMENEPHIREAPPSI